MYLKYKYFFTHLSAARDSQRTSAVNYTNMKQPSDICYDVIAIVGLKSIFLNMTYMTVNDKLQQSPTRPDLARDQAAVFTSLTDAVFTFSVLLL